jgi:hypothetical protein
MLQAWWRRSCDPIFFLARCGRPVLRCRVPSLWPFVGAPATFAGNKFLCWPKLLQGDAIQCPVCFDQYAKDVVDPVSGVPVANCRHCGRFKYTADTVEILRNAPPEKRAFVCGWPWEHGRFGSVPTIDEKNVDALLSAAPLPFFEKEKRLLIYLVDQCQHFGKPAELSSPHFGSKRWLKPSATGMFCFLPRL